MDEHGAPLVGEAEREWLVGEARRLIGFAKGALAPGGGFGWLGETGEREDRPFELYVNCRMTHVFSLGQALRDSDSERYVEAGVNAITSLFADGNNGGWFHSVDAGGVVDGTKTAYGHAFVLLAASSAAARGAAGAGDLLQQALGVFDDHFWDEAQGLVRESFNADWSRSEPYRGANSNMHTVEAFLAAADVTGDDLWRRRALRIADRIVNGWARENQWRIPEHFDENWNPEFSYNIEQPSDPFRPYGATVGHGMEWARLCLHLDAALTPGPGWLVEAAVNLYDRAKRDGWARDGAEGFVYTVDWDGAPVVHERMHWVAAEATAAAAALYRVTGHADYADDFRTWWKYIRNHLVDLANGSWHHELSQSNKPSGTVWTGKPDVYHALQACLIPLLPLDPVLALSAPDL